MSRMCREKGAVKHDDRVDVLGGRCLPKPEPRKDTSRPDGTRVGYGPLQLHADDYKRPLLNVQNAMPGLLTRDTHRSPGPGYRC